LGRRKTEKQRSTRSIKKLDGTRTGRSENETEPALKGSGRT